MPEDRKRPRAGNASAQLDMQIAQAALAKQERGQKPTVRELRVLKRVQARREESLRWQFYRTIPQKHWREMTGVGRQQLKEQAARYDIPFGGATIDLTDVLPALHRFLARCARLLTTSDDGELCISALEELRREQLKLARLKRRQAEGELLPKDEVQDALSLFAGRIKRAGERLQKRYGSEAQEILDAALEDAMRGLRVVADDDDGK